MSPPGRPKGEYRSAQRKGTTLSPPGRPKGRVCQMSRSAQREGFYCPAGSSQGPSLPNEEEREAREILYKPAPMNAYNSGFGRGVAQPGSAPAWGAGGRKFESSRPDHYRLRPVPHVRAGFFVGCRALLPTLRGLGKSGSVRPRGNHSDAGRYSPASFLLVCISLVPSFGGKGNP